MTDWPAIIEDLHRLGLRYIDIAAAIDREEYWVSRVARGHTRKVDYDIGRKLIDLHSREAAKVQVKVNSIR